MAFDSLFYLNKRFCDPEDKARGVQPFCLKSIHDFYTKFSCNWADSDTVEVLEFGGGPVLYSLISASPKVSEITFADYCTSNLKCVELWRDGDPAAHNWTPYISYVINKLENHTCHVEELVKERTRDMRSKVKNIAHCDIFKESLVDLPGVQLQFDIISTHFCLEVATETVNEYRIAVKRLSSILKLGGFIHSLVSLEESYWLNGTDEEHCGHLYLTKDDVIGTYEAAGLTVVHAASFEVPEKARGILNDCKGVFYIVARKLQN